MKILLSYFKNLPVCLIAAQQSGDLLIAKRTETDW